VKTAILALLLSSLACSQTKPVAAHAKVQSKPKPGDCLREPNGDKMWYPEETPFYPEGQRIMFETWPTICKGGKWVTDDASAKEIDDRERPKRELAEAAKTRALTDDELKKFMAYGPYIYVREGEQFRQEEIDRKFQAALTFQSILRSGPKN
jgi:hypothetical protein